MFFATYLPRYIVCKLLLHGGKARVELVGLSLRLAFPADGSSVQKTGNDCVHVCVSYDAGDGRFATYSRYVRRQDLNGDLCTGRHGLPSRLPR